MSVAVEVAAAGCEQIVLATSARQPPALVRGVLGSVDLERVEAERDQPSHELLEATFAVEPDRERRMREARDAARRMHERDRLARGEPGRRDVRGPTRAQETREGF